MSGDECEFDSTWEDEDERRTPKRKVFNRRSRRNTFAAKDMQDFRHSCQGLDDDDISDDDGAGEQDKGRFYNLEFYRGKLRSKPDDLYINDFHQNWWGKYDLLENVHSYIQWLFPIQEPGVNWRAHVLSKKEIKLFRKDKKAKSKLVKSYKLMLDFYGMRLVDESTGEVAHAPLWKDRFRNLNRYTHNNLRITRILKCMGTLGLKHYQAPLVKFFLYETLVMGQLQNVKQSALDYFMFAVLDKTERRELVKYAFNLFKPQEHFVWGPRKILSGQVHCKKENIDQPAEEKQSSIAEDQHKNLHESKHKMNKLEASHSPKEMQSKKDHQNKDEPVIPNKWTETNSDQGANKSSQYSPENENVVKKNQDLYVGVSDGDDNENIALANKSYGHDAVSGSHQTEEKRKKDHQNKDKPVIPNKLTETNSDQGANKSSQCISHNEDVEKQNHEMSVDDDDDVGDGVGVSDDNEKIAPANKSHGHDAASGSLQIEEGSSYQGHDVEMKNDTEHKESEDKQKRLNPNENKHEIEKTEVGMGGEMENKKDHQRKDEPVITNKLSETNSDEQAIESSQRSSQNKVVEKKNHEMSVGDDDDDDNVGDGVGVSDDNENTAPANKSHGHDAASGSLQTEEGSSCQEGHDEEMKDETENKHEQSDDEL